MIEKTILNYLNNALDAPCYMEVPENAPEVFVILEKTASGVKNQIYSAMFAIQSYSANSMLEAAELNEAVKVAMNDAIYAGVNIGRAKLNSDYNYTDTDTRWYRYQAVYDIVYYD